MKGLSPFARGKWQAQIHTPGYGTSIPAPSPKFQNVLEFCCWWPAHSQLVREGQVLDLIEVLNETLE